MSEYPCPKCGDTDISVGYDLKNTVREAQCRGCGEVFPSKEMSCHEIVPVLLAEIRRLQHESRNAVGLRKFVFRKGPMSDDDLRYYGQDVAAAHLLVMKAIEDGKVVRAEVKRLQGLIQEFLRFSVPCAEPGWVLFTQSRLEWLVEEASK